MLRHEGGDAANPDSGTDLLPGEPGLIAVQCRSNVSAAVCAMTHPQCSAYRRSALLKSSAREMEDIPNSIVTQ